MNKMLIKHLLLSL